MFKLKKIYIVLTHTGTNLSKIIKSWTKDEFSHVSIALDEDLKEMYSFGRLHPYNPFWAGLVHEVPNEGTYKRFFRTKANIYSIEVEDHQFVDIRNTVYKMWENRKKYKFNIIGLLAIGFKKEVKLRNHFYCAEFVKYVLEKSHIHLNLPDKMIRPEDFKSIENKTLEYSGLLNKYKKKQLLIILVVLLALISLVVVFGRYITDNINNYFLRSGEFYFESDKLSEEGTTLQVDNWSGVDDYTITINMNSRKNNIEKATYDISYDINYSSTDNVICNLSKEEGIIYASTNTDYFNLTITPNTQLRTGDKVVVDIEVNSTSQYQKTLKGQFILVVGQENISYQITDEVKSPYLELSITNTLSYYTVRESFGSYKEGDRIDTDTYLALSEEDKNKCYSGEIKIEFNPQEVLLDMTSEVYNKAKDIKTTLINGKNYINGFTINIDAISSVDIRFYKVDVTKDYTYPNANNESIIKVTST